MQNFLNVGHATKTFPKYPYSTFKDDNSQETPPQSTTEPTTQNGPGVFSVSSPPPSPTDRIIISPPS